jgi:hypothetical protein
MAVRQLATIPRPSKSKKRGIAPDVQWAESPSAAREREKQVTKRRGLSVEGCTTLPEPAKENAPKTPFRTRNNLFSIASRNATGTRETKEDDEQNAVRQVSKERRIIRKLSLRVYLCADHIVWTIMYRCPRATVLKLLRSPATHMSGVLPIEETASFPAV